MTTPTLTHYAPWDASDADVAYCGHPMTDTDVHSAAPTCAVCAARLADEDVLEALVDLEQLPLDDADAAARALDPRLNAGVDVFAYAVAVTRAAARRIA